MTLDWIDARHRSVDTIARARERFAADPYASVVLDDVLTEAPLAGLRAVFAEDGAFEPLYGLIDDDVAPGSTFAEKLVDSDSFGRADDARRLARESVLRGWMHDRSAGRAAHAGWMRLLRSVEFGQFLTAITGIVGLDTVATMARIMRDGDFCRAHDDTAQCRRLCLLLYVDDGWRPGFGGRFQNVDGGAVVRSVEPLANRLLIHTPRVDLQHQVEAFSPAAAGWCRWTYSIWFSARA